MLSAIYMGANSAKVKIHDNAREGRRTLLIFFYAGHGATVGSKTRALLNSNHRGDNQYGIEKALGECAKFNGVYGINLFACDR